MKISSQWRLEEEIFLFFLTQFRIPFLGSILVPTGQIIMTMCQLKKRDAR